MSPRRNWDSPTPFLASECAPPPGTKGGEAHSPAGEGLGKSQFPRLEKKLSTLSTLWLSPLNLIESDWIANDMCCERYGMFWKRGPCFLSCRLIFGQTHISVSAIAVMIIHS